MEKYFIPYEIALELKELGFDEPCLAFYWNTGKFYTTAEYPHSIETHKQNQLGDYNYDSTSAPTFSQAFRFFRDKYELYYTIEGSIKEGFQYFVYTYEYEIKSEELFNTYEKTELVCLVKLIEIVKEKK